MKGTKLPWDNKSAWGKKRAKRGDTARPKEPTISPRFVCFFHPGGEHIFWPIPVFSPDNGYQWLDQGLLEQFIEKVLYIISAFRDGDENFFDKGQTEEMQVEGENKVDNRTVNVAFILGKFRDLNRTDVNEAILRAVLKSFCSGSI